MAQPTQKITMKKYGVYRGFDLYLVNGLLYVVFLGKDVTSSLSLPRLTQHVDEYWTLKLN